MPPEGLSHKPVVLFGAAVERLDEAVRAIKAPNADDVLAMYLAGLAVECIVQAFALHSGASPDARHDLARWLARCPTRLQSSLKGNAGREWTTVLALWDNGLRYLSRGGLLGYLRRKGLARGVSGGPSAIIRTNAKLLVHASETVCKRGIAQWGSFIGK